MKTTRDDAAPGEEMSRSQLGLQLFLRLGYFGGKAGRVRYPIDFSRVDKNLYRNTPRAELLRIGRETLTSSFASLFESGRDHVVPISGGFDSRLILGALLECTEARNLRTYTYGVPGAYDYELGCLVAKSAGTRHTAFPLNQITYHEDDLIAFARRSGLRVALFNHPPLWELERLYPRGVYWSGYVGDAVAGSYVYDPPSATLEEAKLKHLARRTLVRSTRLHRCTDSQQAALLESLDLPADVLTYDEQVLFAEAVPKYTEPQVLIDGLEFRTPLINTSWMDFLFSLPNALRRDESLMLELAERAFPALFDLPSKNTFGLPAGAPRAALRAMSYFNRFRRIAHQLTGVGHPYVLYNDFNEAIRRSPDLRGIVLDCMSRLKRRGVVDWIDIDSLVRRHLRRSRNHGDALTILTSLELILTAREGSAPA